MPKRKAGPTINYKIEEIKELELFIPMVSEYLYEKFDEAKLDFEFSFSYSWNFKKEYFSVTIEINYIYNRDNLNEKILSYTGEVVYYIHELKKHFNLKKKETDSLEEFLAILTGISISTIRGMIAVRTVGKFQGDFYLPIINPTLIVQDYLKTLDT